MLLEVINLLITSDEAWEIDKLSLSLGKELGSGQFGVSVQLYLYTYILHLCIKL